ncbi:LYR motif-containing protein 4B, partial [Haematococcus lacustris]
MATASEVKALFRAFLREGRRYNNYNVREYIIRVAKERFRTSPSDVAAKLAEAKKDLALVKRQAIVYQLYAGPIKNVLELDVDKAVASARLKELHQH